MAITDKTLIPLGLAVIAIGGAAVWLTNVYAAGVQNTIAINQIQSDRSANIREYNKILIEINSRLSRIEQKIERIK